MKARLLNIALLDQALISGSNFFLTLFLARALKPNEFGLYVFSFTSLVLCIGFLGGLIGKPVSMLGASSSEEEWGEVLSNCVIIFLLTGGFLVCLFVLLSVLMSSGVYSGNGKALRAVAWIVFPYVGQEFTRRILLARFRVGLAFWCDVLTCGGRLAAIPIMAKWSLASHDFAVYLLGSTSLAGMLLGCVKVHFSFSSIFHHLSKVWLSRIWEVAKWTLADWVPFVFYGQLYIYVVAFVLGNEINGALGACRNLMAPVMVLEMGLTSYLVPAFRKMYSENGPNQTLVSLTKVFLILTLPVVGYLVAVSIFAPELLTALFGQYSNYSFAVGLLSIGMFANFAFNPAEIFLLSAVKPKLVCQARLITAIPTIIFCYPLVKFWSTRGALYSFILSNVIMCCAMFLYTYLDLSKANAGITRSQVLFKGFWRLISDSRLRRAFPK